MIGCLADTVAHAATDAVRSDPMTLNLVSTCHDVDSTTERQSFTVVAIVTNTLACLEELAIRALNVEHVKSSVMACAMDARTASVCNSTALLTVQRKDSRDRLGYRNDAEVGRA